MLHRVNDLTCTCKKRNLLTEAGLCINDFLRNQNVSMKSKSISDRLSFLFYFVTKYLDFNIKFSLNFDTVFADKIRSIDT